MLEEWKPVLEYEEIYCVSSSGRIKRIAPGRGTYPGLILKPDARSNGYISVELWRDGKNKRISIHRLVAAAFIPNSENFPVVNHLNGIRDDNRVENLEWTTRSENNFHAARRSGAYRGEKNGRSIVTREIVKSVRKMVSDGAKQVDVARHFNISRYHVNLIVHKKIWKHI